MKSALLGTALVVLMAWPALPADAALDPALVGTWKLDWPGAAMYWVVRPDGVYRLHGPGAASRQLGHMEAAEGRWSIQSPLWKDQGTYKLSDRMTWVVTGQVGTGTWKRVWTTEVGAGETPSGAGACRLVTASEVSRVLYAPVNGGPDVGVRDQGCRFRSTLSSLDEVTISLRQDAANFFRNHRNNKGNRVVDVPITGGEAFAEVLNGGELQVSILKRGSWVTIGLRLTPDASMDDLNLFGELARAIAERL